MIDAKLQPLPESLVAHLKEGTLVPFVGAGLSMTVRDHRNEMIFPSWHGILTQAAKVLRTEQKGSTAGIVEGFLAPENLDYMKAATEARAGLGPLWFDVLSKALSPLYRELDPSTLRVSEIVWRLGSPVVVTTNYDDVLRWSCPWPKDLRVWGADTPVNQLRLVRNVVRRPTVWHLHGHLDEMHRIILTPDGYNRLYPSDAPASKVQYEAALTALRHLFSTHAMLFIGFSMDDDHIRRQLQWVVETFQAGGPHYILARPQEANRLRGTIKGLPVTIVEFADFGAPFEERMLQLSVIAGLPAWTKDLGDVSSTPVTLERADELGMLELTEAREEAFAKGNEALGTCSQAMVDFNAGLQTMMKELQDAGDDTGAGRTLNEKLRHYSGKQTDVLRRFSTGILSGVVGARASFVEGLSAQAELFRIAQSSGSTADSEPQQLALKGLLSTILETRASIHEQRVSVASFRPFTTELRAEIRSAGVALETFTGFLDDVVARLRLTLEILETPRSA